MKYDCYDIIWETDGEEVSLPSEIIIEDDQELNDDDLLDRLSNKTGWLINNFKLKVFNRDGHCIYNI